MNLEVRPSCQAFVLFSPSLIYCQFGLGQKTLVARDVLSNNHIYFKANAIGHQATCDGGRGVGLTL